MIFRLVEALGPLNKEEAKIFSASSAGKRSEMIDRMIERESQGSSVDYTPYTDLLYDSSEQFGYDRSSNPFFGLVEALSKILSADDTVMYADSLFAAVADRKLPTTTIYDMVKLLQNESDAKYFLSIFNSEAVSREPADVAFVLQLALIMSDDSKLSKYFVDTSKVDKADLFVGNRLKPVGQRGDDTLDTIVGVIEYWAENSNDARIQSFADVQAALDAVERGEIKKGTLVKLPGLTSHAGIEDGKDAIQKEMDTYAPGIYKWTGDRFKFVSKNDKRRSSKK